MEKACRASSASCVTLQLSELEQDLELVLFLCVSPFYRSSKENTSLFSDIMLNCFKVSPSNIPNFTHFVYLFLHIFYTNLEKAIKLFTHLFTVCAL